MAGRKNQTIYQLNVALRGSRPLIWRRIQVPSAITLPRLHCILQIVMGWENCHLHEFRIAGKAYAEPDPEDNHFGRAVADERRVQLGTVLSTLASFLEYIYDFGDNWRDDIMLEAILPLTPRKRYPVCVAGARCAPPEDVGGIGGYEHYLKALFDPQREDHQTMLEWRGRFDPEYFPIASINRSLREAFPSPSHNRTSSSLSLPKASPVAAGFASEWDQIPRSAIHSGRLPLNERIRVGPNDQIRLALTARDRELIVEHSLADSDLTERLRPDLETETSRIFYLTFDELEDLAGSVAAEANHAGKKAQKEWDVLYDRIASTLDSYTQVESAG